MQARLFRAPGRAGPLALAQKRHDFSTLRGSKGAAKACAFQGRRGGGESQRLTQFLPLGNGERKGAMKDVSGAERIYGVDREGGGLLDAALSIEPNGASWPPCARQERFRQFGDLLQR